MHMSSLDRQDLSRERLCSCDPSPQMFLVLHYILCLCFPLNIATALDATVKPLKMEFGAIYAQVVDCTNLQFRIRVR